MENRIPLFPYIMMLLMPAVFFGVFYLVYGMPEGFNPRTSLFGLQVAMILLVLAVVPGGLKYITRERMPKKYEYLCFTRFFIYETLCVCNVLFYFVFENPSYFYLAAILWVTMLFSFPTKVKPVAEEETEINLEVNNE